MQQVQSKNFMVFWFTFIVLYLVVCTSAALFVVRAKQNNKASIKRIRAQQIDKLVRASKVKGFKENQSENYYNESLYAQGGGINPNFKKMVTVKEEKKQESETREYQHQLAQYRLRLAEERQRTIEQKRKAEQEAEEELALLRQEREERLKEQALQKQQELQTNQNVALDGTVGPSKTFKVPVTKSVAKKPQQQKTQIGTLKTSKLGESSFQK